MKINNIIITILLALASLACKAQVAGYLGKKFNISYNYNPNLALNNDATKIFKINNNHRLTFGYTFHRKTSIEVSYSYQKAVPSFGTFSESNYNFTKNVNGQELNFQLETVSQSFKANNIDISLKFFGRKTISPIGIYYKLFYSFYTVKRSEPQTSGTAEFNDNSNGYSVSYNLRETITDEFSSKLHGVGIGVGKTQIIYGPLYYNFGFDLKYVHPSRIPSNSNLNNNIENETVKQVYHYYFERDLRRLEVFKFNLGLGILF